MAQATPATARGFSSASACASSGKDLLSTSGVSVSTNATVSRLSAVASASTIGLMAFWPRPCSLASAAFAFGAGGIAALAYLRDQAIRPVASEYSHPTPAVLVGPKMPTDQYAIAAAAADRRRCRFGYNAAPDPESNHVHRPAGKAPQRACALCRTESRPHPGGRRRDRIGRRREPRGPVVRIVLGFPVEGYREPLAAALRCPPGGCRGDRGSRIRDLGADSGFRRRSAPAPAAGRRQRHRRRLGQGRRRQVHGRGQPGARARRAGRARRACSMPTSTARASRA